MHRRKFINTTLLMAASTTTATSVKGYQPAALTHANLKSGDRFQMSFAPHAGMFRHHAGEDILDQIRFAADQGFTAWEDNGMPSRAPDTQKAIGQLLERLNMRMGVFVANQINWTEPTLVLGAGKYREQFLESIRTSIEVAKRCNAKWVTVVPGHLDLRTELDFQTANLIESLKQAVAILEPHGLTMVLEPLNFRDHPGLFLTKTSQAYLICKAVDSPSCKILYDIYHQQIHEGNLLPNIDAAWDEIAYFQIGDNPGRKEPTTGEINYKNVLAHIDQKGFTGILGMEHGNSKEGKAGELRVIEAYREVGK
ncbi:xylose isomerase [Lewinellaceae bacterium SD302]|nr:xylose isomerase [Lewinellaceae bacterium SD302]